MILIISPAKRMRADGDFLAPRQSPVYLDRAQALVDCLRALPYPALKRLLRCNDQIARLNFQRYQDMDLGRASVPALLAYDGIQYQYMAPHLFTAGQYEYVQRRLRILSGLYGVLRPFDAVTPYRLEMGAPLRTDFCAGLYDYWGDALLRALRAEGGGVILNLASEEYARAVRPHVEEGVRFVDFVFGESEGARVVEKGVYVKMARGEMVRYLAERGAERPEDARAFDRLGYRFAPEHSSQERYVFLRAAKPGRAGTE